MTKKTQTIYCWNCHKAHTFSKTAKKIVQRCTNCRAWIIWRKCAIA